MAANAAEAAAVASPRALLTALLHWNDITDDGSSTRKSFMKTILSLDQRLREQDFDAVDSNMEVRDHRELIALENNLCDLRSQIDGYHQTLVHEFSDIVHIQGEMETIDAMSPGFHFHIKRLTMALAYALRNQIQSEIQLMRTLEGSLDAFYGGRDVRNLCQQLGEVHEALKRGALSEILAYYAAVHEADDGMDAYVPLECQDALPAAPSDSGVSVVIPWANEVLHTQVTNNIIANNSVLKAAATFLDEAVTIPSTTSVTMIHVIGDEGCGKTYLCNKIENLASDGALVIRPRFPLDILCDTVGAAEDILVSILGSVVTSKRRIMVLLDDVELLLVGSEDKNHTQSRIQSTFLTVLDALGGSLVPTKHVLLIGFSRTICGAFASRCDTVLTIGNPSPAERSSLIKDHLLVDVLMDDDSPLDDEGLADLLAGLVDATVGKSYAEINFLCRQAVEHSSLKQPGTTSILGRMQCLSDRLALVMPSSMKSGLADDIMDVRVIPSAELIVDLQETQLMGQSANEAWNELAGSIVLPLCRSRELNELMTSGETSSTPRLMCGGVLLTGAPYSGKSFLAHRCACYAASLKPLVKLVIVSCTSLLHKEVGGSENALRRLFDCIRKASPCIVVLDAVENIAAVRGHDTTTEGTLDRVLSTLLVELDGVEEYGMKSNGGFAVIGITQDSRLIDSALLRPGRLDKVLKLFRDW